MNSAHAEARLPARCPAGSDHYHPRDRAGPVGRGCRSTGESWTHRARGSAWNGVEWVGRVGSGRLCRCRRNPRESARTSVMAALAMVTANRPDRPDACASLRADPAAGDPRTDLRRHDDAGRHDAAAAGVIAGRTRRPVEHRASRRNPGAELGSSSAATGPRQRQSDRGVAVRLERADAGFADGALPSANEWCLAWNSAGFTNHFWSPRAKGEWHNPRGWALTLYRSCAGRGGNRPGRESTTNGPHFAAGEGGWRWR